MFKMYAVKGKLLHVYMEIATQDKIRMSMSFISFLISLLVSPAHRTLSELCKMSESGRTLLDPYILI
jgi:hypothetical protein